MKIFKALSAHMDRVQVEPKVKKDRVIDQFRLIVNRPHLSSIDPRLGKSPLRYFAEYLHSQILTAICTNSPEDVLGRFYGEFIRYSGGDGQTLGVVLTPKHITSLFADLAQVKPTDVVFDPCCGTGGFLIAAMHSMLSQAQDNQKENIRRNNLHGIELRDDMFSIATTNMILRGDGKSNLICDNFLLQDTKELRAKNFTVGLMNPPYSQGKKKTTAHLTELKFIIKLLDSLSVGARCVVIVPQSTMVGKTKEDKADKEYILNYHTLEGVITLNPDTFYGVGTNPVIAVFTARQPHPADKLSKFVDFKDDGYDVFAHIGLMPTDKADEKRKHLLDCWFQGKSAPNAFIVRSTVEAEDEWLHSFYYFNDEIPSEADFEKPWQTILLLSLICSLTAEVTFLRMRERRFLMLDLTSHNWQEMPIVDIFPQITRGKRLKKGDHTSGNKPYVSSTATNNGIDGFVSNTERVRVFDDCLTIANSGSVGSTFYHPYSFVASDHVTELKRPGLDRYAYLFLATIISRVCEKYGFNREINDDRLKREKIVVPVDEQGNVDYGFMSAFMKQKEIQILKPTIEKLCIRLIHNDITGGVILFIPIGNHSNCQIYSLFFQASA